MAYPSRMKQENPNEAETVQLPKVTVDAVTVPRASAVGGAPTLPSTQPERRKWWNESDTRLAAAGGTTLAPPPSPAGWTLDKVMTERKVMVDSLAERIAERAKNMTPEPGDEDFWERANLAPDAVAASLIRRVFMLMMQRQEQPPEWLVYQEMQKPEYDTLRNIDLYRWVTAIRFLNGRP